MDTVSLFLHMFIMRGLKLHRWNQLYRKGTPEVPDHEYDALLQIWNMTKMELGDMSPYTPRTKMEGDDAQLWKAARELANLKLF